MTLAELNQKTDAELDVLLAELRGWKWMRWGDDKRAPLFLVRPNFPPGSFVPAIRNEGETFRWDSEPHNFTASLDACAEVERGLTDEQKTRYGNILWDREVHKRDYNAPYFFLIAATARQRTIALILTLQ